MGSFGKIFSINNTVIRAIKQLYDQATTRIRNGNKTSDVFTIKFTIMKDLRQGCCIFPTMFKKIGRAHV